MATKVQNAVVRIIVSLEREHGQLDTGQWLELLRTVIEDCHERIQATEPLVAEAL